MSLYGYARVSTTEQDLTLQRTALKAAGCDVVRAEKASGARRDGRTELQVLLDFLRPGDALVVTRIDRLARSIKDLQDIVHELKAKGVALRATEQPIDTGTAAGKAFLDMLGVFAEFESNLRRERQMEDIAAAKARGVYTGRKPRIDPADVRRCATRRGSARPRSPSGSASGAPASIACSARCRALVPCNRARWRVPRCRRRGAARAVHVGRAPVALVRAPAEPAPDMPRALASKGDRHTTIDDLAMALHKKPTGGHWNSGIALLRNNGLVEIDGKRLRVSELFR